jgi:hypothetical protein
LALYIFKRTAYIHSRGVPTTEELGYYDWWKNPEDFHLQATIDILHSFILQTSQYFHNLNLQGGSWSYQANLALAKTPWVPDRGLMDLGDKQVALDLSRELISAPGARAQELQIRVRGNGSEFSGMHHFLRTTEQTVCRMNLIRLAVYTLGLEDGYEESESPTRLVRFEGPTRKKTWDEEWAWRLVLALCTEYRSVRI